jgi:mono/diheme cytochrome c family protein
MKLKTLCILLFALLTLSGLIAPVYSQDEDEDPDMALLPMGEGREEVFYHCSACHSIKTVVQQRLSRETWDYTLDYMVAEQGMPELDPEERKIILEYLATNVSPQK